MIVSMNPPLSLILAAALAASTAGATVVDIPGQNPTSGSGVGASATGSGAGTGNSTTPGVSNATLQTGLPGGINSAPITNNAGATPMTIGATNPSGSVTPTAGRTPSKSVPTPTNFAPTNPAANPAVNGGRTISTPRSGVSASGPASMRESPAGPGASEVLNGAARGIEMGREAEALGDGMSVRRALDKAFDLASVQPEGRVGAGAGASAVAGRASGALEKVERTVVIANNAPPADAPDLYRAALKTAEETLPAGAAAAVAQAVRAFAERKAGLSLEDLARSAYSAAASGSAAETRRQLKAFDKWEALLGSSGRPLVSNAAIVKSDVERVLALASAPGASRPTPPRVWFDRRGGSFEAILPGSSLAKVPAGLPSSFEAYGDPTALPESPAAAYREYAADPRASRGASVIYRARRGLGASVPSAAVSAGTFWLKSVLYGAWRALFGSTSTRAIGELSALLATVVDESRAAVSLLDAPGLTVGRARAAFVRALASAQAHESLARERGAVRRVQSLSASFEESVRGAKLSESDPLTAGLAAALLEDGSDGLRHWAVRQAEDARLRAFAAATRSLAPGAVAFGAADSPAARTAKRAAALAPGGALASAGAFLWARGDGPAGAFRLSADLRAADGGGEIRVDGAFSEQTARSLDALGFAVIRSGARMSAVLDAQTSSADAAAMEELAATAFAAASGRAPQTPEGFDGLKRLISELGRSPQEAARVAQALDGREFPGSRLIAVVGGLDAVTATAAGSSGPIRLVLLRDSRTGLARYARAEGPEGRALNAAALKLLLPRGR